MNTEYHHPLSSSTAANCKVKTARDETIGSIKDLMIDTENGHVLYVVLEVDSGFFNLDSTYLALPWEAFNFNTKQKDVVMVRVEIDQLEHAPGFDKDNWPVGPQHEFVASVHEYYRFDRRESIR